MLVIISDLHLTDGSSGEIISSSAFRVFRNRLSDMAYDASWRTENINGKPVDTYKPIESLDIILLGDILDLIRSESWGDAPADVLPWSTDRGDDFFRKTEKITEGILKNNEESFSILRGFSQNGDIRIPQSMIPATEAQRTGEKIKYAAQGSVAVRANIYYMVGNHDWFFVMTDPRINNIRNKVIDTLGLANSKDSAFPHKIGDNGALQQAQAAHCVFAEHGDKFDKTNFTGNNRDMSSMGDAVVIKLLNSIPRKIALHMESLKPGSTTDEHGAEFIRQLHELDNLRPYTLAPAWISHQVVRTHLDEDFVNEAISMAIRESIDEFLQCRFVADNRALKAELRLAQLLIGRVFNIEHLSKLIDILNFDKDKAESYRQYAVTMADNRSEKFYVMGHTHYPEVVPMSAMSGNAVCDKIYINTGTWRSMHFQSMDQTGFVSYKAMSIAAFYKDNERKGRKFEFWTGSLDL